jgi:membrane protein
MKRYLNWVLGALAAATAVAALRGRNDVRQEVAAPAPATPEEPVDRFHKALSLLRAVQLRMKEHHIPIIAGSLSYYAFLAIFPAALAAVSIYGLVLDPSQLTAQINSITSALPESTATFISDELTKIVADSGSGLGFTAVLSIVGALWSASAGTKALMTGIDIAYDTPEDRPFIVQRSMALGITLALIVFVVAAASAATFLPDLLDAMGAPEMIRFVQYGRWPIIFVSVIVGLGILFKIAPNRPASESPWISVGAVVVAFVWLLATLGLTVYSNQVGALGTAYGILAGAIVLMLWFFISGLIVLAGAELNAELEARDLARLGLDDGEG